MDLLPLTAPYISIIWFSFIEPIPGPAEKTMDPFVPRQRGFTLLEILLALAVVAVLSFVVFRAFNSAQTSAQVHSAVSDIGTIQANLKNDFPNAAYADLTTTVAYSANVFPSDMTSQDNNAVADVTSPSGGTGTTATTAGYQPGVAVPSIFAVGPPATPLAMDQWTGPVYLEADGNNAYFLTYTQVPAAACAQLAIQGSQAMLDAFVNPAGTGAGAYQNTASSQSVFANGIPNAAAAAALCAVNAGGPMDIAFIGN